MQDPKNLKLKSPTFPTLKIKSPRKNHWVQVPPKQNLKPPIPTLKKSDLRLSANPALRFRKSLDDVLNEAIRYIAHVAPSRLHFVETA